MVEQASSRSQRFAAQHTVPATVIGLGVTLWAVNAMISVTVLPSAVIDIGGVDLLSWATTVYATASIVTSAAGAWAKARLGERGGLALGSAVFGIGAVVCGVAPTMPILLLGRLIEGAGIGLVAALSYMLVRSAFPAALWPRVFGLIAAVWGVAALAGPSLGGLLTETLGWRMAYLSMVPPAIALAALAAVALPEGRRAAGGARAPVVRLALVAAGIAMVALAGNLPGWTASLAAVIAGLWLLALAVRCDRRSAEPLFPSDAVSLASTVGLGLLTKMLFFVSEMPVTVYGPYLLQQLYGASPIGAGYLIGLEALAWAVVAMLVSRLTPRIAPAAMVLGPLMIAGGVLAMAAMLGSAPLWAIWAAATLIGVGFGICWAFFSSRVLAGARRGEEDRAAAAISTVESGATALGAALAGVAGNALGIATAATPAALAEVGSGVLLLAAIPAVLGIVTAFRLSRRPMAA